MTEAKRRVLLLTKLSKKLGLNPLRLKEFAEVDARTPTRWKAGEGIVPASLLMLLALMARVGIEPERVRKLAGLDDELSPMRGRGRPKTVTEEK
jgi:hypothetical protein